MVGGQSAPAAAQGVRRTHCRAISLPWPPEADSHYPFCWLYLNPKGAMTLSLRTLVAWHNKPVPPALAA
jgi:hypothetical protein